MDFFGWLLGTADGKASYVLTRWVFLRALGVIYLIAFVSLWVQIRGLIGSQGILPAQQYLHAVEGYVGGVARYRFAPTVLWLGAGDGALRLVCALGALCAVLLICDVAPVPCLALLWVLYLSLAAVGQDFLAFQWDVLLLETGLLAILFAPGHLLPGRGVQAAVSPVALCLLWWLLFRLTFQSGIVKLTSGDPTWRNLTALDFHFWSQPLPTWTAWYVALLPAWVKKLMVVGTYVFEIGFPFLVFAPRTARLVGCAGMVFFQLLILATGNYNFFNLLTIALALLLLDDGVWAGVLPARLLNALSVAPIAPPAALGPVGVVRGTVAAFILVVSLVKFWHSFFPYAGYPRPIVRALAWVEPFRSVNNYGLFRVMTTERPEIVIEGSDDGTTWRAYEFPYKPGDPLRRPAVVEPHQPRLDWQMWFAALSRYEATPWFHNLLARLLQGSPPVLALLRTNPFPDHPPKYVRAQLYDYRFTGWAERRRSGAWWSRAPLGAYSPAVSLTAP